MLDPRDDPRHAALTESVVRGTVTDRPWGVTLAALGLESRTGELALFEGDRAYRVTFLNGAIVAATSPIPADSAVRVALTTKRISPAQASQLKAAVRAAQGQGQEVDEVALIAQHLGWSAAEADPLRQETIERCAARTFAVERGEYLLEDRPEKLVRRLGALATGPASSGHVDVRAVVYLGARRHLADTRLAFDLRLLGSWFVLKPKTVVDLSGFGFTDAEVPVLEALRGGTNLAALEARNRALDPRAIQAVIYALATCDALVCCEPPAMTTTAGEVEPGTAPTVSRVPTPREPTISRVPTPRQPTSSTRQTEPWGVPTSSTTAVSATHAITTEVDFLETRGTTLRPQALAAAEVQRLISERAQLLDEGTDHFTLLGVPPGATPDEVRAAYIELARYLEPKKLASLGIRDETFAARRLFAQICIAVTVLTDPVRRREYIATLR